jgi:hypothetical protein
MKSTGTIEGTVKFIIDQLHKMYVEEKLDDSDYIRCVKIMINATDTYLKRQKEITVEPSLLKDGLYTYSKELWLKRQVSEQICADTVNGNAPIFQPDDDYQDYYYDYIYSQDLYPR